MKELDKKLENLPPLPGVYLFRDERGEVIYIGKAKNLRARVKSYFAEGDTRFLFRFLRPKIADLEFMLTDTEKEALILENHLIKKYQPRYNIRLRDDKTYFHLRLTTSEKFPRLLLTRRPKKSKDLIFGPFASAKKVRETIRLLQGIFPLRRCTTRSFQLRDRPCINYEIGKCSAPCAGKITPEEYQKIVEQVIKFLRGEGDELIAQLEEEMKKASEALEFEKAARLRDQIQAIRATLEKQKVEVNLPVDRDVIGYWREADRAVIYRLGYRQGKLLIGQAQVLRKVQLEDKEVLSSYLKQFYSQQSFIPKEILIPFAVEDQEIIQEWLQDLSKRKVEIMVPEKGEKRAQVELANQNAQKALEASDEREKIRKDALEELKKLLRLRKTPHWIECYDISNLGEKLAVGSMVKFVDGEPQPSGYRRFRIKGVAVQNDYEMMREILTRRFRRALEENQLLPDLIILDGGKGQLNIARAVLDELGIKEVELASLAKERQGEEEKKPERIYIPGIKDPIKLKSSPAKHLLVRIRDEAHRFALSYHRLLRKKMATRSVLLEIPGIGPKKQQALLRHFGSLKKIQGASLEELLQVKGISKKDAQQIKEFFASQINKNIPSEAKSSKANPSAKD